MNQYLETAEKAYFSTSRLHNYCYKQTIFWCLKLSETVMFIFSSFIGFQTDGWKFSNDSGALMVTQFNLERSAKTVQSSGIVRFWSRVGNLILDDNRVLRHTIVFAPHTPSTRATVPSSWTGFPVSHWGPVFPPDSTKRWTRLFSSRIYNTTIKKDWSLNFIRLTVCSGTLVWGIKLCLTHSISELQSFCNYQPKVAPSDFPETFYGNPLNQYMVYKNNSGKSPYFPHIQS